MSDLTTYWQSLFNAPIESINALTQWHAFTGQSYMEWVDLWQQWQTTLVQWLTNWSDLSGYALQSNPPFGMLFPPMDELSRVNQAVIDLMERSTDSLFTGFGALAPGRAAELTDQVAQLETAISSINHHLEVMTTRLEVSESSDTPSELAAHMTQLKTAMTDVTQHLETLTARFDEPDSSITEQAITEQVEALRGQMQTTHEATMEQLTALAQRLDKAMVTAPSKPTSPRATTRRKPKT